MTSLYRRGIELSFHEVHVHLGLDTTTAVEELKPWALMAHGHENCVKLFHTSPPCSLSSGVHKNCTPEVLTSRQAGGQRDIAHGLALLKSAAECGAFHEWTMEASIHRTLIPGWDE